MKCHEVDKLTENGGPVKLVLWPRYRLDETNTLESVAVLLRPGGLGVEDGVRGAYWHIEQTVTYTSKDEHAQKIELVEFKAKDGTTKQYIAGTEVSVSADVPPDVDRLKSSETNRLMDCVDCHNRVGHEVPSPDKAVDEAIADGRISADLPFIKRDGVALLNGNYPSLKAADAAIAGLRTKYAAKYPLVLKSSGAKVNGAIDELKQVYRLIATPAMKVQAKTCPDNLGHQSAPGCLRCHDDAHFLVVKGKITSKKIPSACATCHTFPQVGANASSFPLGVQPDRHKDRLNVFNQSAVKSLNPAGRSSTTRCSTTTPAQSRRVAPNRATTATCRSTAQRFTRSP